MISDPGRRVFVSSLGWVDHGALWTFDPRTRRAASIVLDGGARYLSLHPGESDRFVVAHHFDGSRLQLTVHAFEEPKAVLAGAALDEHGMRLEGNARAWKGVPCLFVDYLRFLPWNDFVLVIVDPSLMTVRVERFSWYGDAYDKGYQGIVGVLQIPGEDSILVSIQRCSTVVVQDLATGRQTGSVQLAGRAGNPKLRYKPSTDELWADDYDTIVVLDRQTRSVLRSRRVQESAAGTRQFIGEFSLGPGDEACLVARPFEGDVIELDAPSLTTRRVAKLGGQPLEALAWGAHDVVARDWKTGRIMLGTLAPH